MAFDPTSEQAIRIFCEQVEAAAQKRVYSSVAGLGIPRTDITFSGLFIRHGRRRLIATVAHGTEGLRAGSLIHVFSKSKPGSLNGYRIVELAVDRDNDVALVELDEAANAGLGATWWDLSVATGCREHPRLIGFMVGFPSADNKEKLVGESRITVMTPMSYLTNVTKRPLPTPGAVATRDPDPELDILIEIDVDKTSNLHGGGYFAKFDPRGMSGAGLFLLPGLRDDEVWSGEFVLAGIQCGHFRDSQMLRAARIELIQNLAQAVWPR